MAYFADWKILFFFLVFFSFSTVKRKSPYSPELLVDPMSHLQVEFLGKSFQEMQIAEVL